MVQMTMLSSMASADFLTALDRHIDWGLHWLDLKDHIFGKGISDLTDEEAVRAREEIERRGLEVYCLSSTLGDSDIEAGEAAFRASVLAPLDRLISVAGILRPRMIRLLAARSSRRAEFTDCADYLDGQHPWVWNVYRAAIDRLHDAGQAVTIENETHECLFAAPEEIVHFFERLDRQGHVSFTWDVQNLWQMGTFPSRAVYETLKPWMRYYHVKGGQSDGTDQRLVWRSSLEEASWPVQEITAQVIADGVSPVLCLNTSHGRTRPGQEREDDTERDLAFLRRSFPEIE